MEPKSELQPFQFPRHQGAGAKFRRGAHAIDLRDKLAHRHPPEQCGDRASFFRDFAPPAQSKCESSSEGFGSSYLSGLRISDSTKHAPMLASRPHTHYRAAALVIAHLIASV